jgi:hypothetical protein
LRNGAPFKDWLLPSNLERIRRKLRGSDDGDRQMVKVLSAVLTDGLASVDAACAEALTQGVYSADVIINILARSRDPAPPVTIMTPDALKLHHAPVAVWRDNQKPKCATIKPEQRQSHTSTLACIACQLSPLNGRR